MNDILLDAMALVVSQCFTCGNLEHRCVPLYGIELLAKRKSPCLVYHPRGTLKVEDEAPER